MNDDSKTNSIPRRDFVKLAGLATGAVALTGTRALTIAERTAHPHVRRRRTPHARQLAERLNRFVDPLPIPATMPVASRANGIALYDVEMMPFAQQLHRDLAPTTLWGYRGASPGPTFEARRGEPIRVLWRNGLPDAHVLPIDMTIHGAEPDKPAVRTVVHLHGHKVLPGSDGYPEAWFTRDFRRTGPYFKNRMYDYPNDQRAATLWYHDHALGITRLNNYMGLAGMYILRDDIEQSLNLPSGRFEIPLIIQDRSIGPDGALIYPTQIPGDPDPSVPPIWIPEFFGETVLVNGKVWPFLTVEPRKYRFRILNASNARFYRLALAESTQAGALTGRSGPSLVQIGSDGGLLSQPVPRSSILAAPAERFDVIVDFSDHAGNNFVLTNDAPAPFPDGDDVVPGNVMMFRVSRNLSAPDVSSLPARLPAVPMPDISEAVQTRDLVLGEIDSADPFDNPIMATINDAHWDDPVTERPRAGSTEIWRIINTTEDAHPIHLHLVQFQVLDRQPFDADVDSGASPVFTGPRVRPPDDERFGLKDTVKAFPGEVVRLLTTFDLPNGTLLLRGQSFRYVFHCHILEHEEHEMMRPYDVIA